MEKQQMMKYAPCITCKERIFIYRYPLVEASNFS